MSNCPSHLSFFIRTELIPAPQGCEVVSAAWALGAQLHPQAVSAAPAPPELAAPALPQGTAVGKRQMDPTPQRWAGRPEASGSHCPDGVVSRGPSSHLCTVPHNRGPHLS